MNKLVVIALLAFALALPGVLAQNCTNCTVTMVDVTVNEDSIVMSVTLYLLAGFAAIVFLPKIAGEPDLKAEATWKGIVGDAWRRAFIAGSVLIYFVTGAWLYNQAVTTNADMRWLFVGLAWVLGTAMFLILAYMTLKLVASAFMLIKKYTEAERYGRDHRND